MAELKTRKTKASVAAFLAKIADEGRRKDCKTLVRIKKKATGAKPEMWGPSVVGCGSYHYKYESGREGDWFLAGFSPRKQDLTLYIMSGFSAYGGLLAKLGKHKNGKACLYLKRLADVDLAVLEELVSRSVEYLKTRKP
jgi:hypothetical protein